MSNKIFLFICSMFIAGYAFALEQHTPLSQFVDQGDYETFSIPIEGFQVEIMLDKTDDFTVQDAKNLTIGIRFIRKQLKRVKSLIPAHAYRKLSKNVTIEYRDKHEYSWAHFHTDGESDHRAPLLNPCLG